MEPVIFSHKLATINEFRPLCVEDGRAVSEEEASQEWTSHETVRLFYGLIDVLRMP